MQKSSSSGGKRPPGKNRRRNPRQQRPRRQREYSKMPRAKAQAPPSGFEIFLFKISFGRFGRPAPPVRRNRSEAEPAGRREAGRGSKPSGSGRKPAEREPRENRPRRPPEQVEVTSGRLYVGNLSYDATESDLEELFSGVGDVRSAEVVCHRRTQRSKGYAFVEFKSIDDARRAVADLHDQHYMGRKLVVSGAKKERPDEAA